MEVTSEQIKNKKFSGEKTGKSSLFDLESV